MHSQKEVDVVPEPTPTSGYEPPAAVRLGAAGQPATGPRINHPILLPESDTDDESDLPAVPQPRVTPRPAGKARWYASLAKPLAYIASGITGAVIVTTIYSLLGSRGESPGGRSTATSTSGPIAAADVATLDRRADSLALAIEAFALRGRMYDSRRMGCAGLSRGLQQVEDAWLGYNVARKATMAVADSVRDNRDRSLYADVRGVELRFERSSCPRP
ncbi:MAG TPA: hypothetical protein VG454_04155 [Gemmatimonadales bacterium]|nr:hypothetical protein [Gemmatimonadales bacterium]